MENDKVGGMVADAKRRCCGIEADNGFGLWKLMLRGSGTVAGAKNLGA